YLYLIRDQRDYMLYTTALSTVKGYSSYGAEQGEKVSIESCNCFNFYVDLSIEEDDIFKADGSKSDISRLQVRFGSKVTIAIQDPSYPIMFQTMYI
ncbi:unnamed protein product, partial [Coffea canephora]